MASVKKARDGINRPFFIGAWFETKRLGFESRYMITGAAAVPLLRSRCQNITERRGGVQVAYEHNSFYDGRAWRDKRRYILQRDRYLCQRCLRSGRLTPATMVHHIKPLEEYPEYSLDDKNLISLCNTCHEQVHVRARGKSCGKKVVAPKGVRVIKA